MSKNKLGGCVYRKTLLILAVLVTAISPLFSVIEASAYPGLNSLNIIFKIAGKDISRSGGKSPAEAIVKGTVDISLNGQSACDKLYNDQILPELNVYLDGALLKNYTDYTIDAEGGPIHNFYNFDTIQIDTTTLTDGDHLLTYSGRTQCNGTVYSPSGNSIDDYLIVNNNGPAISNFTANGKQAQNGSYIGKANSYTFTADIVDTIDITSSTLTLKQGGNQIATSTDTSGATKATLTYNDTLSDGEYTLSASATNQLNTIGTQSVTFIVDSTAPTAATTANGRALSTAAPYITINSESGITFQTTCTDALSDVSASGLVFTGTDTYSSRTLSASQSITVPATEFVDGQTYSVEASCTDANNHYATYTNYYTVDNTVPAMSLFQNTYPTDGSYTQTLVVDGAVYDNTGKNVLIGKDKSDVLYGNYNGGAYTKVAGKVSYDSKPNINHFLSRDGVYTFYTEDEAGNQSAIYTLTIDTTDPTIENISVPRYTNNPVVTVTGTIKDTNLDYYRCMVYSADNRTGLGNIIGYYDRQYSNVENGDLCSIDLSALGDGTYNIRVVAYDQAGRANLNGYTGYTTTVDTVDPIIKINHTDELKSVYNVADGQIYVEVIDSGSGNNTFFVDGALYNDLGYYDFNLTLTDGEHTIQACDKAGNCTAVIKFVQDFTAPAAPTLRVIGNGYTNDGITYYQGAIVRITSQAADRSYITYRVDSGNDNRYLLPIIVTSSQTICATVTDINGNVSPEACTTVDIDLAAPTVATPEVPTVWTNTDVTVTVAPTDSQSGVPTNACIFANSYVALLARVAAANVTGRGWGACTTTVSQNGTTYYAVRDNLGNVATGSFTVDKIDRVAPQIDAITWSANGGTVYGQSIADDGSTVVTLDTNLFFEFLGTDAGGSDFQKFHSIQLRNADGTIVQAQTDVDDYYSSINFSRTDLTEGEYYFYIEMFDNAGNYADYRTSNFTVAYPVVEDEDNSEDQDGSGGADTDDPEEAATNQPTPLATTTTGEATSITTDSSAATTEESVLGAEDEQSDNTASTTESTPANTDAADDTAHWSLINLIATIVAVIAAIGALIRRNSKSSLRTFTVVIAVVAIVAFVLTQDLSLTMGVTDGWSFLMIVLGLAGVIGVIAASANQADDKADK
jgi:hypothetical protein